MKITILAVGRIKERFYEDAIREYSKRLSRYVNLCIEEVSDEAVPEKAPEAVQNQILQKEADRLEKVLDRNPGAYVTALAIEGKMYDSVSFSSRMADLQVSGKSHLIFVIGGSIGLSSRILNRAHSRLSFSKMTFPHQLMRVILLEQIYRAIRIERGEPYHK